MFINNIDPVLFSFGPFEIRYYGLVYVFAFLATYFFLFKVIKQGRIKNMAKKDVEPFLIYVMLGVILGARIFEIVFYNLGYYFANPLKVIAFWEGGMSFHGGLFGALVAVWLFCRRYKVNILELGDFLVLPAAFFLALGRLANFTNHELYGPVTDVPWCVKFRSADGCRHPYQIYSAIKRFFVFIYLFMLYQKQRFKRGFVLWMFVLVMGIGRFVIDFWRAETTYFGVTMGQILSVFMIIPAAYILLKHYR